MALDMNNKLALSQKILPAIDFHVTTNGVTVSASERLSNPRFLEFDIPGRCRNCRSSEMELDFIVCKEGVTIYCTRFREKRFIPFNVVNELPGHCFVKIRNKGRVLNVPFGDSSQPIVANEEITTTKRKMPTPASPPPNKKVKVEASPASPPPANQKIKAGDEEPKEEAKLKKFYDSLSAATTFMDFAQRAKLAKKQTKKEDPPPPPPLLDEAKEALANAAPTSKVENGKDIEPILREFYDSMAAATLYLDQKPEGKISNLSEQRKKLDEELKSKLNG